MVFLDSNIFIIDRFFTRDKNYPANKQLLEQLRKLQINTALPYYTLLEVCGITSFNLSSEEQERWLYSFQEVYPVNILDPYNSKQVGQLNIADYLLSLTPYILKKMTVGDAIFLREAEMYNSTAIVTWNKKHFLGRTGIQIHSPDEYLVILM
ncbi:MAG: hypothetical protein STSR0004_04150 [Peptococcaceae bacterium]